MNTAGERLREAVGHFLSATSFADPDGEELLATAQEIGYFGQRATAADRNEALGRLRIAIEHDHPQVGGLSAITCGALVEQGADPAVPLPAIWESLPGVLTAAEKFAVRVKALLPPESQHPPARRPGTKAAPEEELYLGTRLIPSEIVERLMEEDWRLVSAWRALETFALPAIVCLSQSKALRREAHAHTAVRAGCQTLVNDHGSAEFLLRMLRVLDDEAVLVLYPDTRQGFLCRMSGIADNFQLHVLLADTLIAEPPPASLLERLFGRASHHVESLAGQDRLSGDRPDPRVVAVMRGEGVQTLKGFGGQTVVVEGTWNLYAWTVLKAAGGRMPPTGEALKLSEHWIWGEGVPEDIPAFEGLRIVLLGPPSYARYFDASRVFDKMEASVVIEDTLDRSQVEDWLRRFREDGAEGERPR